MTDETEPGRLLLEAVADDQVLDLIISLIEADSEEVWLRERLADAVRD